MQINVERVRLLRDSLLPPVSSTFVDTDWRILSKYWYPVAWAHEVKDRPLAVTLLDVQLVLYRSEEAIVVALDRCPHRGVPLSKGNLSHGELACAYHGLRFDGQGHCRLIPAHPSVTPSDRFNLLTFPSVEQYGLIWTSLSAEGEADIPAMPVWDDPSFERIHTPWLDIAGSSARQVEGFIDVAHFAFVHNTAFADPDNVVVPLYDTEPTDFGLRTRYFSQISNYPKSLQHLAPQGYNWLREFEVYPPFTAKLIVHFPNQQWYHILNAASPVSARKTRLFVPIARNFDTLGTVEDVLAFNAQIFAEDKVIVESQLPIALDSAVALEENFAADKTSVAFRRLLKEMGLKFA